MTAQNATCTLIRELLPNYTEQIVSSEAEALISAHLASCPACEEQYTRMKAPFTVPPTAKAAASAAEATGGDAAALPIVSFLKKRKRLKRLFAALLCVLISCVLCLSCVSFYMYLSRGIHTIVQASGAQPNGTLRLAGGGAVQEVCITFLADAVSFPLGNETGSLTFQSISVKDTGGTVLAALAPPYRKTVLWPMPLQEDSGTVRSLLMAVNDRDVSESTFFGNFYALSGYDLWILHKPGADGYLLCYGGDPDTVTERIRAALNLDETVFAVPSADE